jgi:hypothetical protein
MPNWAQLFLFGLCELEDFFAQGGLTRLGGVSYAEESAIPPLCFAKGGAPGHFPWHS